MNGYAPLSPTVIRDWAAGRDLVVHPHEYTALFAVDRVLRTPPDKAPSDEEDE